ncbi:MAG: tetratricopeptide repeat protein [Treponema sp.]|jgi:tetratricopeptide (TPR) repeat protein|nr:tetratricopeptide repeat protein [Treponema sp.]
MAKDTVVNSNFGALHGVNDAPLTFSEKLSDFIQKRRRALLVCAIGVVAILVILIAVFSIIGVAQSKSLSQVEAFNRRYETLFPQLGDASKEADVQALVQELAGFAPKHSGYAGAQAYSMLAALHAEQKNWSEAESAWKAAAQTGAKTFLEPVYLFSAAVAAEEQSNTQDALDLYTRCVALADHFPAAPRAQFAIGRLEEELGQKDAALEAYRELARKWPDDATWTNLAQSKIIALSR